MTLYVSIDLHHVFLFTVTTCIGNGQYGFADGVGTNVLMNGPRAIYEHPVTHEIYLPDIANYRIRKFNSSGLYSHLHHSLTCSLSEVLVLFC